MRKIFTCFLLGLSIGVSAQNRLIGTADEQPIKFSGFITHKVNGKAPLGEMANSLSFDKLQKTCHFFEGDSLDGFDFEKYSKQTLTEGGRLLSEYKNRMQNYQIEFVKSKFHLNRIPKFEKENTCQIPEFRSVQLSGCNNIDFEDGNLNGWNISSGMNSNSNGALTVMGTGVISTNQGIYSCNDVNIINSSYGNDVIGLPGLDPNGGSTSVRLGGFSKNVSETAAPSFGCVGGHWSSSYSNGEKISKTITVTTANALLAYDYEVVLNDGGHPNGQQPYFHVYITNPSGIVLSNCTQYYVQGVSGGPPVGFTNSGFVNTNDNSIIYYKPWTSNSINLTPYIGQTVVVSFVAAGCTLGAHFSYAYVDAICGPVEVIASNNAPCTGTIVTLTAPSVQNGTYSWSGPGISGSTSNQTITISASGTYTVTITPSQGASCAYTITKQITFKPSPTAAITTIPTTICAGGTVALNASVTGGSGVYPSTVWTGTGAGGLSSTIILNPNFTNSVAGSYPLTFTVTDDQGCTSTANTLVTVNGNPVPSIIPNSPSTCTGIPISLNTTTTGGSGIYTSNVWTGVGAVSLSATNITNPVFTNSTTNTYPLTFTVTDNKGCVGTASTIISVNFTPTAIITASGPTTLCPGGTVVLDAGAGFTGYLWSDGSTTQTISVSNSGTYSVHVTTLAGCTDTAAASVTITVNSNLNPTITTNGPSILCAGGNVTLDAGAGYSTYVWSNGATTQTINVTNSGNYSVTVADAFGCSGTSSTPITLTVYPNPTPILTTNGTPPFCAGGNITIDAETGYSSYAWSNGATTQTITVANAGNYSVLVTDTNGCSGTSASITVNPNPTPTITASGPTTFCSGVTLTLDAGSGYTSYLWSNEATSQVITVADAGTYSVTVTDNNGCIGTSGITTIVNPLPVADTSNTTVTQAYCGGNTGAVSGITITSGQAPLTYTWHDASGAIVGNTANLQNVGNGVYSVTITDANGCSITEGGFSISSTPHVVAAFTTDLVAGESPLAVNFTNGSTGATNYLWQFGTGETSALVNPSYVYVPLGNFNVCLIASNAPGCADTACSTIDVYFTGFLIPNVFTPNNDNINDIFTVEGKGLKAIDVVIYDRWGLKLYEWHKPGGGWDGFTASGLPSPDGIYYYIINGTENDGKKHLEKGAFSLIRGEK